MPYVEGESLRDRLTREKQLAVEEAVRITTEVASALDYAHRHGVVHRDIKPENILLHDGRALVADFGIALAASKAGGTRMTETGMSLGTPHYMSPEQAMGEREITARSDVYALGAVLYEMLSGDPPFTGSTAQAVVARVVTEAPRPLLPQRHTIPPHVEAATLKALEKLPADRFASAAQFAEALMVPTAMRTVPTRVDAETGSSARRLRRPLGALLAAGVGAVALAGLAFAAGSRWRPAPASSVPTVRWLFSGSDSVPSTWGTGPWPAAMSPDGSLMVYEAQPRVGASQLYLRRSDQLEGRPIPGTDGGGQPVFSPDGRWLAFEVGGVDKKVRLDGSAPVRIAEGSGFNGADWTTGDELVIGSGVVAGLSKVSVAGGEFTPFTAPDSAHGDFDHVWPIATPDGKTVVFTIWHGALPTSELAIVGIDGGPIVRLGIKAIRPLAIVDGALLYLLADGAVMAAPLDIAHRRLAGKPVPVLDPVPVIGAFNGNSAVFVSPGGALVTGLQASRSRLTWVSRNGSERVIDGELRDFSGPRLSPDGRQIAVLVTEGPRTDVWIKDLEAGTLSRLTTVGNITIVEWSRDGKSVIYTAPGSGSRWALWRQSVAGGGGPELIVEVPLLMPAADLAPDGRTALLQPLSQNSWDVRSVTLDSAHTMRPFHVTSVSDLDPRISPDGRWAAVTSNESGAFEVYVRSYPDAAVKAQISVGGGSGPTWSPDGTRLYYASGTAIIEAKLATSAGLRVISRDTAFSGLLNTVTATANYDVTRDGSRLVLPKGGATAFPLIVVPNWRTELRERLATSPRGN
jgi:serine/threonine-protein kinase